MLIFNLRRVFALRGIDKPHAFLVKNGFAPSSASNMLQYYPLNFKIKTLEKLCRALNCTPNDLFEWRDDKNDDLSGEHALNALRKQASGKHFSEIIKEIPLEKLGEMENYLESLKKQ